MMGERPQGGSVLRARLPRMFDRRILGVTALVALAAFVWSQLLARDLFVMTEARWLLLEPGGAEGRQVGQALFGLAGRVCGVDAACVNTTGSGLTAVAVAVLVAHTWQLLRSLVPSVLVAGLWVASAPLLNTWLWQATWSDLLGFTLALAIGGAWWWVFFRLELSRAMAVAVAVGSLVAMVVALETTDTLFLLAGVMPLLAVVRSQNRVLLRRNLLLCIVPLAWAAWSFVLAVTHTSSSAVADLGAAADLGPLGAVATMLGLPSHFMGLTTPPSADLDTLRMVAIILYVAAGLAIGAAAILAYRRWRRPPLPRTARDTVRLGREWSVELYLGVILAGALVLGAWWDGLGAYELLLPWWAALTLLAVLLRRWRALPVIGLFAYAAIVAYGSLIEHPAVAPRMVEASRALAASGERIRSLLGEREVRSVAWRAEGEPFASWYLLRDSRQSSTGVAAGPDLWPWLTRTTDLVPFRDLGAGMAAQIAADLAAHDGPGEVVVVIDDQYGLVLLAWEGEVLFAAE